MNWTNLESQEELQNAIDKSFTKPVVIFKHSTRCSVSSMAKRNFETGWENLDEHIQAYFLDLLSYRAISNTIADELEVIHASPQIILVKDGKSVFNASHNEIEANDLQDYI